MTEGDQAASARQGDRAASGRSPLVPAAVALLASLGCAGTAPRASDRPNLVVLLSDDHRWDALGAAGNPAVLTPVMDRMVREG